jgi:hypothetical protein
VAASSDAQAVRFAAIGAGALALGAVAWFFLRPKKPPAPAAPPAAQGEQPPPIFNPSQTPSTPSSSPDWKRPLTERWQLLQSGKWLGPEWFYADGGGPTIPGTSTTTRVDALYVYTRQWTLVNTPPDDASGRTWHWAFTAWETS